MVVIYQPYHTILNLSKIQMNKIARDETFCNDTLPDAHLGPGCSLIKAVKSLLSEKRL